MKIKVNDNGHTRYLTFTQLKELLIDKIGPWQGWVAISGTTVKHTRYENGEAYRVTYDQHQVDTVVKWEKWNTLYRQMRFAHSQVDIMSEHGVLERLRTHRALRNFCDKWSVPTIHDVIGSHMFYRTGATYLKKAYDPWLSFQQWMQVN